MNIFYVDDDPALAAQALVDKHVVKMIVESGQLLSTAHRVLDGVDNVLSDSREGILYKATHKNHPSAVWVRQSIFNYGWLHTHMASLMDEYEYRYQKHHKSWAVWNALNEPPYHIPFGNLTEPPACMPDEYKVPGNIIESYRNYYRIGKKDLHTWKNRKAPKWIEGDNNE